MAAYTFQEAAFVAICNPEAWLEPTFPGPTRLPYREFPGPCGQSVHCGQLKLLMSEVEFLGVCLRRNTTQAGRITVVYVGAADGKHIPALDELFRDQTGTPIFDYILVDPAPFSQKLVKYVNGTATSAPNSHIRLVNEYFTDAMAAQMPRCLFISDARRATDDEEVNATLKAEDHDLQLGWLRALPRVEAAMLKFSLPYTPGTTIYPAGWLRYQVFAPLHSTEMRLILMPEHIKYVNGRIEWTDHEYDHTEIEQTLYCRNLVRHKNMVVDRSLTRLPNYRRIMAFFGGMSVDVLLTFKMWERAMGQDMKTALSEPLLMRLLDSFARLYGQTPAQRRVR